MSLDLSSVATELMDSLGKRGTVTLVRVSREDDPEEGTQTETKVQCLLSAVNLPAPESLIGGAINNDQTNMIKATDRLVVIDGQIEPVISDLLLIDGKEYRIIQITTVNHAGTPQIYKVVARG